MLAAFLLGVLAPGSVSADWWFLESRSYFLPVPADVRGNGSAIGLPFATFFKDYEYSSASGALHTKPLRDARDGVDIALGKELGLLGLERGPAPLPDPVAGEPEQDEVHKKEEYRKRLHDPMPGVGYRGAGLWVYLHWHMLDDMLATSAPLVNNDYRLGGAVNAMWQPRERLGLRCSLKAGHESSHIGDEVTLANADNPVFSRVNVSYEFVDVSVGCSTGFGARGPDRPETYGFRSLGMPFGLGRRSGHGSPAGVLGLDFRIGTMVLVDPGGLGMYSYDLRETHGRALRHSRDRFEHYAQATLTETTEGTKWFVSMDVRRRIIYKYAPVDDVSPEAHQYSANVLVGLRDVREPTVGQVSSIFFRYYRGVNPNGQFQNQRNFWMFGPGISFDL